MVDRATRRSLRDRDSYARWLCIECRHYTPGRCTDHGAAGLASADAGRELATTLQRCPGFKARP
jgi:hypothetical protein